MKHAPCILCAQVKFGSVKPVEPAATIATELTKATEATQVTKATEAKEASSPVNAAFPGGEASFDSGPVSSEVICNDLCPSVRRGLRVVVVVGDVVGWWWLMMVVVGARWCEGVVVGGCWWLMMVVVGARL